ncbi:MAG: helix-turn-helix domain-containing protein [Anaerolineaceae bacterium]
MIGKKLHERRKELGLSLRELGDITDLTASFLSQVENDATSPSISSLQRIATALKIPMFALLEGEQQTEVVIRHDNRKKLSFPGHKVEYELLTRDLAHQLGCFAIHLKPGSRQIAQPLYLPTEEVMVVIKGAMEIGLGERVYTLEPGDSIHYEGINLRFFASIGKEELYVICIMTPPAF